MGTKSDTSWEGIGVGTGGGVGGGIHYLSTETAYMLCWFKY